MTRSPLYGPGRLHHGAPLGLGPEKAPHAGAVGTDRDETIYIAGPTGSRRSRPVPVLSDFCDYIIEALGPDGELASAPLPPVIYQAAVAKNRYGASAAKKMVFDPSQLEIVLLAR